ncbi:MAG: GNAT family N-acetyltransferase [Jatrophihabitans sp.]|uniref:GNAT family N-acetyltransferase n=1 Tax=Jatrophihabitans sp. TaxID=1932789 RepID=UPI003F7FEB95
MDIRLVDALTTRALRRTVLRPSWPVDEPVHGDDAPDSLHLGAYDGDELVAACILLPRPYPQRPDETGTWQLRGMATAEAVRGRGVGTTLLDAALDEVRRRGGRLLWCEARVTAIGFYARNGFTVDGPEYAHAETGAPHHYASRPVDAGT